MSKKRIKATRVRVKQISPKDIGRAAYKLQREKDGEIEISDASAPSLREYALRGPDLYAKKQSEAAKKGVQKKQEENAKRNAIILARFQELSETKSHRNISSIIAKEQGLHRDTVTRIIKEQLKNR